MAGEDSRPEYVPSEISRAGGFLVLQEGTFSRVGISSNVYVANHDGKYYLFDASGDPELMRYLSHLGIAKESLGAVFLTHGHYDHVRGLLSIPDGCATVFLSGADRPLAEECLGKRAVQDMGAGDATLALLGLEVVKTPGHTPGSVCLYSRRERLLISGDTVFSEGFFGRTDLPGGSNSQMIQSLTMLSHMELDSLLPGHGKPLLKGASRSVATALENALCLLKV